MLRLGKFGGFGPLGIIVAKLALRIMRLFPESINSTAKLPVPERFGSPETQSTKGGSTYGITKKKGSFGMKNSMRFIALSLFVLCLSFTAFAQTSTTGVNRRTGY